MYGSVRRGEIDKPTARKILDDIRGLRIRFLGDRSMQDHAWQIAAKLNWPDTYQAEYIALTQLQADALVTADGELAQLRGHSSRPHPPPTSSGPK